MRKIDYANFRFLGDIVLKQRDLFQRSMSINMKINKKLPPIVKKYTDYIKYLLSKYILRTIEKEDPISKINAQIILGHYYSRRIFFDDLSLQLFNDSWVIMLEVFANQDQESGVMLHNLKCRRFFSPPTFQRHIAAFAHCGLLETTRFEENAVRLTPDTYNQMVRLCTDL